MTPTTFARSLPIAIAVSLSALASTVSVAEEAPGGEPTSEAAAAGAGSGTSDGDTEFALRPEALHGAWVAEFDSIVNDPSLSEQERELATAMLTDAVMMITFGEDGSMLMQASTSGSYEEHRGTWSSAEVHGEALSFTTVDDLGEEDRMTAVFSGPDDVRIADASGEEVRFRRADPEDIEQLSASMTAAAAPAPFERPPFDPDFVATEESVHGTWSADFGGMIAEQDVSAEERQAMRAMLAGALMDLTFEEDGTLHVSSSMLGQVREQSGSWSIVDVSGNTVTVSTTLEVEGGTETESLTLTFHDSEFVSISDPLGETLPFVRRD